MPTLPTVAVIGAGSSGIAAAKALHERGVPFTCFEASDRVGGNWVFGNKNGMSAAYRQLFINTSRDRMEYSDYPMPKSYPDFPHHTQIAAYFDAYVEHFGFRDRDPLRDQGRARASAAAGGGWELTLDDGSVRALRRAARRQRPPLGPALARADVPRPRELHRPAAPRPRLPSTTTCSPTRTSSCSAWATARWTSRSSPPTSRAARTWPRAAGRGSSPSTCSAGRSTSSPQDPRMPFKVRQRVIHALIKLHVGDPERYGLPTPDHKFGEAHPTVSGRILDRIAHGDDHAQAEHPPPRRRRGRVRRRLARARRRRRLLHGLQDQLPVLRRGPHLGARQPHRALPARLPPGVRRRVLRRPAAAAGGDHAAGRGPGRSGSPTTSRASTRCRRGPRCCSDIADETAAMRKRYVASKRHTIQVDFDDYLHALGKERRARRRARARGRASGCRCAAAGARRRRRARWRAAGRAAPRDQHRRAGKRERTKAANREAILVAARARVRRHRLRRRVGARRRARDRPRHRHLLQLLPRQGVGPAGAGRRDHRRGPRARAHRADGRHDARGLRVAAAFAPTSSSWPRIPTRSRCMRRNAGTIRAMFDEPALGAGIDELRADLEAAVAAGLDPAARRGSHGGGDGRRRRRDRPAHGRARCRSTWSAPVGFVTNVFLGAFERMRVGAPRPQLGRG